MRTRHIRTLAIATFALVAIVGVAVAQTSSPALLNALEVRQLVGSAQPDDHARLGAHFAALAEQYAGDATRFTSFAVAMGGNPNRRMAAAPGAHWTRLAELSERSAATLRELAAHHGLLAAGAASTVPRNSARFEGGEGAPTPTTRELARAAATARTVVEHAVLAEYFLMVADRDGAAADEHAAMASALRGNANARGASPAVHCDRMAKQFRESAELARRRAAEHLRWAPLA